MAVGSVIGVEVVMSDSVGSDGGAVRIRLDTGDAVEVDGSSVWDPDVESAVPAVVLRLPGDRAHAVAHALADWSRVCALVTDSVNSYEQPLADALAKAAVVVGDGAAAACSARDGRPTVSAQRMSAAAELQRRTSVSAEGLVAVIDAAAGYVDDGADDAAVALLTAVAGEDAAGHAYAALVTPLAAHHRG
jgi:hypothetical protein